MLEVPVAVVDMIHVIAVGDRLACVTLIVRARVAGVYRLLGMPAPAGRVSWLPMTLVAVHVVDVVVVLDGLAPVARVVLVIGRFSVGSHLSSLPAAGG